MIILCSPMTWYAGITLDDDLNSAVGKGLTH